MVDYHHWKGKYLNLKPKLGLLHTSERACKLRITYLKLDLLRLWQNSCWQDLQEWDLFMSLWCTMSWFTYLDRWQISWEERMYYFFYWHGHPHEVSFEIYGGHRKRNASSYPIRVGSGRQELVKYSKVYIWWASKKKHPRALTDHTCHLIKQSC